MRTSALTLAISLGLAATAVTSALAQALPATASRAPDGVPNFNIGSICGRVSGVVETSAGCADDEQNARDELNKAWTHYDSSERARCADLSSASGLASYVELLTCLQLADDAKKLPNE
jgi:hypothetical protein